MIRATGRASYVNSAASGVFFTRHRNRYLSLFLSLFMLCATFGTGMTALLLSQQKHLSTVVSADDDSPTIITKAAEAAGLKKDDASLEKGSQHLLDNSGPFEDDDDFYTLFSRLINTGYLNRTPKAFVQDGKTPPQDMGQEGGAYNCYVNHSGNHTPMYHNCDIPNIITEFLQKAVATLSPQGFDGAVVHSAQVANNFGLPSAIPGDVVPLDYASKGFKYTGLELFGYNMKYTNYRGEWDHIQVMNEARALSNFGLMDKIRLGGHMVAEGIAGAGKGAVDGAADGWRKGGPIGAVAGFTAGIFKGAAERTIRVLIDTSDFNIFATNSWYRIGYGGTLYHARELDQTELAANIATNFMDLFRRDKPDEAKLPDDFMKIQNGPPPPKEPKSKCLIGEEEIGANTPGKGISKEECEAAGSARNATAVWQEQGNQVGETLAQWKINNKEYFDACAKYQLQCAIDTAEGDRENKIPRFLKVWQESWNDRKPGLQRAGDEAAAGKWVEEKVDPEAVRKAQEKNPDHFNAPWNRFVCTDDNGKDLAAGNGFVFAFTKDKQPNPSCKPVRPPIQNGYFGNGYVKGQPNGDPGIDTRRTLVEPISFTSFFFGQDAGATLLSNMLIDVAAGAAQITNTALDFSFSPIMKKLGLDTKVVNWIESLRDSVYFGLLVLVLGFSAITAFLRILRNRSYRDGMKELLLIVGTIFLSIIVLAKPQTLVQVVDEAPARVETAIVGVIFGAGHGENDQLCEANNTKSSDAGEDLEGNALPVSPTAAVRTMECEVWRTFVFEPYIAGQWGTAYNNLYAAGYEGDGQAGSKALKNSNQDLVGNAEVKMGNSVSIHNWGLYQLDLLSSGTATTASPEDTTNVVPRDMFRIVDAQAGPDNGAKNDGSYLNTWAGRDPGGRVLASFMGATTSIIGGIAIISYSLVKIELSIISMLMLVFLPLFLLLGTHPTFGRVKMKGYIGTILSLMVQRVMLVTLMAVMLKVLLGIAMASAGSYLMMTILSCATSLLFLLYRKDLLNMVQGGVQEKFGPAPMAFMADSSSLRRASNNAVGRFLPGGLQGPVKTQLARANGAVSGFVGGALVNGMDLRKEDVRQELRQSVRRGAQSADNSSMARQRQRGFSDFSTHLQAAQYGARAGEKDRNAKVAQEKADIHRLMNSRLPSETNQQINTMYREKMRMADGTPVETEKLYVDVKDSKDREDLLKLEKIDERIEQLNDEKLNTRPTALPKKKPQTRKEHEHAIRIINEHHAYYDNQITELKESREKIVDKIQERVVQRQTDPSFRQQRKQRQEQALDDMRTNLQEAASVLRGYEAEAVQDTEELRNNEAFIFTGTEMPKQDGEDE